MTPLPSWSRGELLSFQWVQLFTCWDRAATAKLRLRRTGNCSLPFIISILFLLYFKEIETEFTVDALERWFM